jgi:hypothetical protein
MSFVDIWNQEPWLRLGAVVRAVLVAVIIRRLVWTIMRRRARVAADVPCREASASMEWLMFTRLFQTAIRASHRVVKLWDERDLRCAAQRVYEEPLPELEANKCKTDRCGLPISWIVPRSRTAFGMSANNASVAIDERFCVIATVAAMPLVRWKSAIELRSTKMVHRQSTAAAAIKKLNLGSVW